MLTYQDWVNSVLSELRQKILGILALDPEGGKVKFHFRTWIGTQKLMVLVMNGEGWPLSTGLSGFLDLESLEALKDLERVGYPIPYTVLDVDGVMYFAHEVFEKFLSKHSDTLIDYYQTQIEGGASEQEQDYAVLMVQTVRTYEALKGK